MVGEREVFLLLLNCFTSRLFIPIVTLLMIQLQNPHGHFCVVITDAWAKVEQVNNVNFRHDFEWIVSVFQLCALSKACQQAKPC